jgi:dienelactone hydrolase
MRRIMVGALLVGVVAACGGGLEPGVTLSAEDPTTTSTPADPTTAPSTKHLVVSDSVVVDETGQDVVVFAPDADGAWPVVVALHGRNGSGEMMAEMATRLAQTGLVVFAPTYRGRNVDAEGQARASADVECGYRQVIDSAADYGGDLDQPLTVVGYSLGARYALLGSLAGDDPLVACSAEVPAPDVVVAVSGCYYESRDGAQFAFDPSGWGNRSANIVLIGGGGDDICPAWQTQQAAEQLRDNGYTVDVVMIPGASHLAPAFYTLENGDIVVSPDDPVGLQVVDIIVNAIE